MGGSEDSGVERAAQALLAKMAPGKTLKLGWTMEIELGGQLVPPKPGEPVYAWRQYGGDKLAHQFIGWNPVGIDFALYHMTGARCAFLQHPSVGLELTPSLARLPDQWRTGSPTSTPEQAAR